MSARRPPDELQKTALAAAKAIEPIKPHPGNADPQFRFKAFRTDAGGRLPAYFFVYFLLVDLLGFPRLGRGEKTAWTIPIEYKGATFAVSYEKFGLQIYGTNERLSREVASRIGRGVTKAQPYFDWLAEEAVQSSKVNVLNNSGPLLSRLEFLRERYQSAANQARAHSGDDDYKQVVSLGLNAGLALFNVDAELMEAARWLALSAIEAFFSWTEHVFIHMALLNEAVTTGTEVAKLAESDWAKKFKLALSIDDIDNKAHYDLLTSMRRQLRNFVAHGAFGRDGEAFSFHSATGAVPVMLPHKAGKRKYALGEGLWFNHEKAMQDLGSFMTHLWSGPRKPYRMFIESGLPFVLSRQKEYASALDSENEMKELLKYLLYEQEIHWNMDW